MAQMTDRSAPPSNDQSLEERKQLFLQSQGPGALDKTMGIEVIELNDEQAIATMPVEGNTQVFGLLHGGAYAVLGELLGSMHANFIAPEGMFSVGIEINASHTGSATSGKVTGVCTVVAAGRTLATHEIVISDDQGRRCSTVRITNLYRNKP